MREEEETTEQEAAEQEASMTEDAAQEQNDQEQNDHEQAADAESAADEAAQVSAEDESSEDESAEGEPSEDDRAEVDGEAEMREMIGYIARVLVDDADAVQVSSTWGDDRLNINLKVAEADKGKVIGRRGRVVHAMQSLLRVAATKSNMRAGIDVE